MRRKYFTILLAFIATSSLLVNAGGPLVVKGGKPVTYGNRPFLYRYDKGPLGRFSNSEAIALIEDLYASWESIKTSQIKFQRDNPGFLDFDVTDENFKSILTSDDLLEYTAVVFDTDGKLLDAFLGEGAGTSVLGLSGPITINSGPLVNQIAESQAIFNGKFVNGIDTPSDPESSIDSFKGTIIHETGHGIGLDHTQINVEAIRPGASQEIRDAVPLEFPVAVNDLFIIRRDDISSVSLLYPNESELTMFGKIEGKVFRNDGMTPVLGTNVIARNIDNPTLEAISCVSDFLNDGTGSYTLFAVPPGKYKIEIEPIDLSFTGGSGVGPHTKSKTDKSFISPVPEGFYTGPNMPVTPDETKALIVEVQAAQTVSDANIVATLNIIPLFSSSSGGNQTTISEIEPNNKISGAQNITPPVKISGMAASTDEGEIDLLGDAGTKVVISDLFEFTISQSFSISALLTIESDSLEDDLDLVLFNANATDIIESSSQTGNVDELISRTLESGTYLLGIGAFTGSASYSLTVATASNTGPEPTLTLSGPEAVILKPNKANIAKVVASATDFSRSSKCLVLTSSNSIKVKPLKFSLSNALRNVLLRVKIPKAVVASLINNNASETVTVNVTCENGAFDDIDIDITPTIEKITTNEEERSKKDKSRSYTLRNKK